MNSCSPFPSQWTSVPLPLVLDTVGSCSKTVKAGSHYIYKHTYTVNEVGSPVYNYLILTQEESLQSKRDIHQRVRTANRDIKLYKLEILVERLPHQRDLLLNLDSNNVLSVPCRTQSHVEIQNAVLKEGCEGIIDISNNLVLFAEDAIAEVEYNIHYKREGFDEFLSKLLSMSGTH